jgi:hypothetical protein
MNLTDHRVKGPHAKTRGYFLLVTGFAVCPCHLPITLPFLLALTAGTVFGAFLANNVWLIVAVSTIYFLGALTLGWRYVMQAEKSVRCIFAENFENQYGGK